jgi:hypothetical protein
MKKRNLKLALSRETLRQIDSREAVAGDINTATCNFTCTKSRIVCCATGGAANSCPCA